MYASPSMAAITALARATPLEYVIPRLAARRGLPPLVARRVWDEALALELDRWSLPELFGSVAAVHDQDAAAGVRCGLALWNDDLETALTAIEPVADMTGDFWRGISHRRGPVVANCRYWFQRCEDHELMPVLRERAIVVAAGAPPNSPVAALQRALVSDFEWNPIRFANWCAAAREDSEPLVVAFLEGVQYEELLLLLRQCLSRALGRG